MTSSPPVEQARVLIYSHESRGLGHLPRLSLLGERLQQSASVLFLSSHRESPTLIPPECEYVRLPSVDSYLPKAARHWGRKLCSTAGPEAGHELRKRLIQTTIDAYRPHAILVDYLPLGTSEELDGLLAPQSKRRHYYISRGILGEPGWVDRSLFTVRVRIALHEVYDRLTGSQGLWRSAVGSEWDTAGKSPRFRPNGSS